MWGQLVGERSNWGRGKGIAALADVAGATRSLDECVVEKEVRRTSGLEMMTVGYPVW